MKKHLIFLFLLFIGFICYGQSGVNYAPADTIRFRPLETPLIISGLESFNADITDSIYKPAGNILLLTKKDSNGTRQYLALKNERVYALYPLSYSWRRETRNPGDTGSEMVFKEVHEKTMIKAKRYQLDGRGHDELVIEFNSLNFFDNGNGRSIWQKGFVIIDIDRLQFADLIYYTSDTNWPYGHGLVATNSGMTRYYESEVIFARTGIQVISKEKQKKNYIYKAGMLTRK